jgi:hypothetical protein
MVPARSHWPPLQLPLIHVSPAVRVDE